MSTPILLLVSFCYALTGLDEMQKNPWWLGFWCSYAMANVFYILATKQ